MPYHLLTYSIMFLPTVILLYQLCPARFRFLVLLAADYTFFCMISGKLIVWLLGATMITYGTGRLLSYVSRKHADMTAKRLTRKKRGVLAVGIILVLNALLLLKYLRVFGISFVVPIGISYYTLQAISYMTDVYRGTIQAERNVFKIALYLSFFPQIMEGPISRFSETAEHLYAGDAICFDNLAYGYQRIIWGLFKKMLIADRLAPLVSKVFSGYQNFDGAAICVGVIAYTMQLYMEFSGCMDIIMGTGEIFGVRLPENFRQPFFAKDAGDFWHRWHITLGTWLKDYVFYPISLAKPVKKLAKYVKKSVGMNVSRYVAPTIALFFVWLTNGIWHGPKLTYLFYGMYYFVLIFIENITEAPIKKIQQRLHICPEKAGWRVLTFLKMFVIVNIGELFFRSDSLQTGFGMLGGMLTDFHLAALIETNFGIDAYDIVLAIVCICIVFVVDVTHERGISIRAAIASRRLPARWCFWYAVIVMVVVFGAYGAGYTIVDMIYAAY